VFFLRIEKAFCPETGLFDFIGVNQPQDFKGMIALCFFGVTAFCFTRVCCRFQFFQDFVFSDGFNILTFKRKRILVESLPEIFRNFINRKMG